MAEEGATLPELRGLDGRLESLSVKYSRHAPQIDSRAFCADFCKLVEGFCGVQGGPAPQLRVLEVALCYFFRASSFLLPHCDHVQHALSSLALSVFELLLFLDQKEFIQEALPQLTLTLQECHLALARHPNVYLLRLKALLQEGGPWGNRVLQAVLHEAEVPQSQVDRFLSSEPPLFLELRVRYLLVSGRGREAAALARRCAAAHPSSRQRVFFLQVHLAFLCTTERTEQLHREVCALGGGEVVQVVCAMEEEEEVLLRLCRAGLRSQLLGGGHAPCLRQLVCVWGELHRRLQTSGPELLEESRQLLLEATNATAIFPFIRVLLEELGEGGLPFCVELCSRALGSGLLPDGADRALVHKTVAGLLPRDLEVCRACALLVFFQDRSLGAYRTVVRLYSLPDQEYHAESAPVGNHVRFDLLQALKKDLVFDPEFWNVAAIRSNCQKLLSGEEQRAARQEEVPEEAHCTKEASVCPSAPPPPSATAPHRSDTRRRLENGTAPKRTRLCRGAAPSPGDGSLKNKTKHVSRIAPPPRESGEFLRRSWQPGRTNNGFPPAAGPGEPRRITRFSEKNCSKRRIRTPRWLLEDSGTLEMDAHRKGKKLRRKRRQQEQQQEEEKAQARALLKRSASAPPRTDTKEKGDSAENQSLTRHLKGLSLDYLRPASPARLVLELSLPDNELADIFTEESLRNGLPPVLLYQASPRLPGPVPADRPTRLKHVVIRASDEVSLAQQLHCYSRSNKHLAAVACEVPSAVVTRSSSQAHPTKGRPRLPRSKPLVEMKVTIASHAPVRTRAGQSQLGDRGHAKVLSSGSRPADNKASPITHRPLAPGCTAVKTARRPTPDADTKPSLDNVAREVGHSNAHKDLASLQPGDSLESALTDTTADNPVAKVQRDAGGHGGDMATGRASDTHYGRRSEEDLHGLRLLSETVSALAPQSIPEASGEAMEERSLPAQQSPTLGSGPDSPSDQSACSPSAPDSEEERAQEAGGDRRPAQPGSDEPRLEHRCTLCDKVFRGKRVAVHAMFHYRRYQCMFCCAPLKHDHLATLHVSEHIDALKRRREAEREERGGGCRERSEELQSIGPPPTACGQRRHRTPLPSPASAVRSPSGSRRLRSDGGVSKGLTPSPGAKVNGHLKGPTPHQQRPSLPVPEDKPALTDPLPSEPARPSKQTGKRLEAGSAVATETSCPVAGCPWRAALSRSSVALLYHALEAHPRDHAPLRLAFSMFNGQCSVCLRVLWSFQHYRHHVERHRLTPRHPCLHQGCGARFRTGMEMRRHSRRHRPLQASCCVPGCTRLFICLWALNLHEREHYIGGDAKPGKARGAADPRPRRTGVRPDQARSTPVRGTGLLKVRERAAVADPHSEVRAGGLGTGRSTLRRSPGSRQVQGVQGPSHCPAGPRSAASHKLRRTPLRQRAEPVQPAPVASGHRMRRSGRPVKLDTVGHKTKNPPVPSTESSTTAAVQKPARKREGGHFLVEERQSYHKSMLTSTSHEVSAPLTSKEQEQSAPLDQEQSAPVASADQEQSAPVASADQEQSAPVASADQEQSAPVASADQEQSAPVASADQEQSAPVASADQEQSAPVASADQEQSAPLASADQEQSAPLASADQEQLAPLDQEQSAPLALADQEQSAPLALADQEHSAPLNQEHSAPLNQEQSAPLALADQEQSAPVDQEQSAPLALADQEQSAPLALADQEQSAPLDQEQSAPLASADQERSAPLDQEQSAPLDQEQSAPLASADQEQSAPVDQEQLAPLASADQEQSAPVDQEQSAPLALADQEQSAPLDQEQSAPLASADQERSAPLDQEQSAPLDQEQSAPLASADQEQSAPVDQEQSAPLASADQEQSGPLNQEHSAPLNQEQLAPLASADQEQSAPVDQEQSAPVDQEQSAPLASADQEQSAPVDQERSAPVDQEQSAPLASVVQEQSVPLEQEQSAPLASVDQEQSAPLASVDQKQSAPLDQEQSAPLASVDQKQSAALDQEQSAPLASVDQKQSAALDQEQSAPLASVDQKQSAALDQEQSAPLASVDQEQSAPLASVDQEQSAPLASVDQEQSAPLASADQEQPAPLDQEQSAPLVSVDQKQSAPLDQEQLAPLASVDQEQSAPLASVDQEQSAPLASADQEQSNRLQGSKKHKPISAAPSNSDVDLVKKGRVAHLNSDPKTKAASTGNATKSKCKTQTKIKDLKVAMATKTASVAKATKAPSVAKAKKAPLVAKATKAPAVAKATKAPAVAKATKAPAVAKATKPPSVAKATKPPSIAKATKPPSVTKATKPPSVTKATEVTAVAKATEVTAVTKTGEIPQEALATGPFPTGPPVCPKQRGVGDGVGYTVLINGAAAVKRKAADEAPPPAAATSSYRKTYFRAPPTTYLDERFTNMPKRRKHMSMFCSAAPRSPEPRPATRCPSCFSSFLLQEELQAHLGDHRCSSMFGFDSDEDNS